MLKSFSLCLHFFLVKILLKIFTMQLNLEDALLKFNCSLSFYQLDIFTEFQNL